jgi:hypothetical protein
MHDFARFFRAISAKIRYNHGLWISHLAACAYDRFSENYLPRCRPAKMPAGASGGLVSQIRACRLKKVESEVESGEVESGTGWRMEKVPATNFVNNCYR